MEADAQQGPGTRLGEPAADVPASNAPPVAAPAAASTTRGGPAPVVGWVLFAAVVAALAVAGLVLDRVTEGSANAKNRLPAPAASPIGPAGAHDDFARTVADGLGQASSGRRWIVRSGSWAVDGGEARVTRPDRKGPSLATIATGDSDGTVSVKAATTGAGMGLAFRCQGPANCWWLQSVPRFGTWNVIRIVRGKAVNLGNLGTAPVADGTTIAVTMNGPELTFAVNGQAMKTITDESLRFAVGAGLMIAPGPDATRARWADFDAKPGRADPGPQQVVVADSFARGTRRDLGRPQQGPAWREVAGDFAIRNGRAVLARPPAPMSLALVAVGAADGTVQTTLALPATDSGLAFRCRDIDNCWRLEAVPGFGTWNVTKVVNGTTTELGNLGTTPVGPGTTVRVEMAGDRLTFSVNGLRMRTIVDGDLRDASGAGLVARGRVARTAQWMRFVAAVPKATLPSSTTTTTIGTPTR